MQMYPLATIHSCVNNEMESTHTPLVYQPNEQLGVLVGYIDKYNPQVHHLKKILRCKLFLMGLKYTSHPLFTAPPNCPLGII